MWKASANPKILRPTQSSASPSRASISRPKFSASGHTSRMCACPECCTAASFVRPGCAVADIHTDGLSTIWSGGQKPHALQKGFAELLRVPLDKVRVIWVEDAGSYGRPGFEDTAADAVLLSQAVGKPVRVQWSRADMTAWGTKGPAVVCDLAAAIDERGEIGAVDFTSRAFSGGEIM